MGRDKIITSAMSAYSYFYTVSGHFTTVVVVSTIIVIANQQHVKRTPEASFKYFYYLQQAHLHFQYRFQ